MKALMIAACIVVSPACAAQAQQTGSLGTGISLQEVVLDNARIARLKRALRLTPMQEHHWPAVEAALRMHGRIGFHGVLAAALPLIRTLDAGQRRDALAVVRGMGMTLSGARL